MGDLTLILGGARSGKSRWAERLASERGGAVVYLATLEAADDEMRRRIHAHRASRPESWRTIEEPLDLIGALSRCGTYDVCLLDCLTLWVSNLLLTEGEGAMEREADVASAVLSRISELIEWQHGSASALVVVSNEVGSGLVPEFPLGRLFRDVLGEANQLVASAADGAFLCVAGYALDLKRGIRIR